MLTLEQLVEISRKFEEEHPEPTIGGKKIPNPADVHPSTYELIKKQCVTAGEAARLGMFPPFGGQEFHCVPNVEPGFLHPCRCRRENVTYPQTSSPAKRELRADADRDGEESSDSHNQGSSGN